MKTNERRQVIRIRRQFHEIASKIELVLLASEMHQFGAENCVFDWSAMVRWLSDMYHDLGLARDLTINAIQEYCPPGFVFPKSWVKRWEGAENSPSDHSASSE